MTKIFLNNKYNIPGILVVIIIFLGLFGPWLTYSYDSYAIMDPVTKMGQLVYHSKIELNPIFGSIYKDDILVEKTWLVSFGTSIAGLILALSASLSIFNYNNNWVHFILFSFASVGFILFFLSIGNGISFGLFTKIGWGLKVTGVGLLGFFIVSLKEMSRDSISRFMD